MLPGGSGIDPVQVDEKAFDRIEAMIYSMTKEEREKPSIINPKRKRRIAAGSGFDETAVTGEAAVSNNNTIEGSLLGANAAQTNLNCQMMGNPNAFRGLK